MNLRANACIIIKMALLWCLILIPTAAKAEVAVAARLTAQDKIDLKRVEDYLERLSTLKSSFLQTSSNGNVASGSQCRGGYRRFGFAGLVADLGGRRNLFSRRERGTGPSHRSSEFRQSDNTHRFAPLAGRSGERRRMRGFNTPAIFLPVTANRCRPGPG